MKKNYPKSAGSLFKLPQSSDGVTTRRHLYFKIVPAAFILLLSTISSFAQTYCTPTPGAVNGDGITNVTLGSINNNTVAETGSYGDYTAQVVSVGQSVEQAFSITLAVNANFSVKVWVDWNNDFDFDDEGEEVFSGNSPFDSVVTLTGAFTVPATAALGNHRIRIGGALLGRGTPPTTPCYSGFTGAFEDYTINVTPPPTCFVPVALATTNVNSGTINVSWAASSHGNTPVGYEYAVDTTLAPPVSGTAVTGTSVAGLTVPLNGYLHVRSNCGDGDYSQWVTIPFYNGFCIPAPSYGEGNGITNVTIGTINNTTVQETGYYGDYSAQIANIGQGVTQPFSITLSTNSSPFNTKVWVDWNNDLDFDDAGEEVYNGTSQALPVSILNGTFTVPSTATLGNHRIRVGSTITWNAPVTTCNSRDNAIYEDYTINVIAAPSCFTPTNVTGVTTATGVAAINWTAPTPGGTPSGYEYAVTASSTPPETGTATTATSVSNITVAANATSYIHVRTNCGNNDFSNWYTAPYYNGFCTPRPSFADGTGITNVTIGTINNTTVREDGDYGNYANLIATAGQGVAQPFSVSMNVFSSYNTKIWVDWNNDLDFDDEGEEVYSGASQEGVTSTITGYINVPIDAIMGNHRLRVGIVISFNAPPSPCQIGENGAYEDYTLNVTGPPVCYTPTNFAAQITGSGINSLSWTAPAFGNTPTGYEYAVTATSTPPANGTAITGTTVANVSVTANTTSYLHVRTNCGDGEFSEWVTIPFYNGVCIPRPSYASGGGITNFTAAGINNTTAREEGEYGNFSNLVATIGQTVSQPFSIGLNVFVSFNVRIWADWNDDLDFNDAGEQIYAGVSANAESTILRGTFTVPATAALGNHRLRIGISPGYSTPPTPCSVESNGAYEDYTINVTVPPTCFMPGSPAGMGIAPGTASLSWTAPTLGDAPAGYQYAVDTNLENPATGTTVTGTTIPNYTGITDAVYYYLHVRTSCGDSDFSEWVTSAPFRYFAGDNCETAINLGSQPSPYTYTTEGAANDYASACTGDNVAPDLYYYIDVPNGYTVVIEQASEEYDSQHYMGYGGACPGQTPLSCGDEERTTTTWENISGATVRVYWVQDGFGSTSAGSFTLNWSLLPPASCDRPRALSASVTSLTSAVVSWNVPNTGTPVGYEYAVTASSTAPESGTYTTARSATVTTLIPNTISYLHVRTICSEADGNSIWVTYQFFSGYCVPTNPDSTEFYITGVSTTGGDTNFSNTSTGFSAYTDYTSQYSVTSYAGGEFNIQATAPNSEDTYLYSVWIDWNNDFDFEDNGERVINTSYLTSPANLGAITIPTTAAIGTYRMRVRNARFGAPVPACGDQGSGEAEDYTLNIVAGPACFPPFNPTIAPTDAGFANLTWGVPVLGDTPTGYEYVLSTTSTAPAGNGTAADTNFVENAAYNPAQSVYLFVRSICGPEEHSTWVPAALLGTNTPEYLSQSVIVYKENGTINITTGNTLMTGVTIYDTSGRKLYSLTDINNTETAIAGLQIQQQVVIVEVTTVKGKVSKRIIF
ncbi:hypothetical protein Q765_07410 [Flavobacterium rivuli WB 3.3-2 = DSM 21788]|uniref:Fibronectin type-III domain-containing protein n=1 Tax=Flavobacterium rivuli WB 3.3-2 = DSM 21788 TaxID=1121895 RepID=A0A0A2M6E7_9FLAO|nr:GEVED domain-containing protein [Flavobacterium rivuli]KGO87033.1 hypothetical protein Q765_07410 [Flavobacterium rivuli WB 3.3-2 = DSM 21788]